MASNMQAAGSSAWRAEPRRHPCSLAQRGRTGSLRRPLFARPPCPSHRPQAPSAKRAARRATYRRSHLTAWARRCVPKAAGRPTRRRAPRSPPHTPLSAPRLPDTHTQPAPQRPWREFFGRFSFPKPAWPAYERRVAANASYYRANYAFLSLALSAWTLLRHWRAAAALAAVVALWTYFTVLHRGALVIGRRPVAVNAGQRRAALLAASAAIVLLSRSTRMLAFLAALCAGACLLHASLRSASGKASSSSAMMQRYGTEMRVRGGAGNGALRFGGLDSGGGASDASPGSPTAAAEVRAGRKAGAAALAAAGKKGSASSDPEDGTHGGRVGGSSVYAPVDAFKHQQQQAAAAAAAATTTMRARRNAAGTGGGDGWVQPTTMTASPVAGVAAFGAGGGAMVASVSAPEVMMGGGGGGGGVAFYGQQPLQA
jgi:hypothetical protein